MESFPHLSDIQTQLEHGLKLMGKSLSQDQVENLVRFLALLNHWNDRFNLTAIRSPLEMVRRHLLDSLSVQDYLVGDRILDVGTGAGLPGIPLSIVEPERHFYLLDSSHKRQVFVAQAIRELSLIKTKAVHSAVEAYQAEEKFSTILARAFAPLPKMIMATKHLLGTDGQFVAMMGKATPEQLMLPEGYRMVVRKALKVPGETAERHVVIVKHLD